MPEASITKYSQKHRIKIIKNDSCCWQVNILFPSLEVSDREMIFRLREAKQLITEESGVPSGQLELHEDLDWKPVADGISVDVSIVRKELERGRPVVHLRPSPNPSGISFDNMIAQIDLHCLDEFGVPITVGRIVQELGAAAVENGLCKLDRIERAVETVTENGNSIKDLIVAEGVFPADGVNAEFECSFYTSPEEADNLDEFNRGRKVRKKDVICQKTSARRGEYPGRNVLGEETDFLTGQDFELVNGEGTDVSHYGNILTSTHEGLASIELENRRIVTSSGEETFPKRIVVTVNPVIQVSTSDIGTDLVVFDSVEVSGNLKSGQSIITKGEIFLSGNMEPDSTLRASGDIRVDGKINQGIISSDDSFICTGNVVDTLITVGGDVLIEGKSDGCKISGGKIKLNEVRGSSIIGGHKVTIQRISDEVGGEDTTIQVGRKELYKKEIEAYRGTIRSISPGLSKLKKLFGSDNLLDFHQSKVQQVLVQQLKRLRTSGDGSTSKENAKALRRLLESIHPMKEILEEKSEAIKNLLKRSIKERSQKPIVVIREGTEEGINIKIEDRSIDLPPSADGIAITTKPSGEIVTYNLRKQSADSASKDLSKREHPQVHNQKQR